MFYCKLFYIYVIFIASNRKYNHIEYLGKEVPPLLLAGIIFIFVCMVKIFESALKSNPYTKEGKPITEEVRKKLVFMAWISPVVAIVIIVFFIFIVDMIKHML